MTVMELNGRAIVRRWALAVGARARHAWALVRGELLGHARENVDAGWFTRTEVGAYDDTLARDDAAALDQATWRDLDLDACLRGLADGASIFGRQYLYTRLRRGGDDAARSALREVADATPAGTLDDIGRACEALHRADVEPVHFIFQGRRERLPAALRFAWTAGALWIAGLALLIAGMPNVAACAFAAYGALHVILSLRYSAVLAHWKRQVGATVAMLSAARALNASGARDAMLLAGVRRLDGPVQRLIGRLAPRAVECNAELLRALDVLALYDYVVAARRMARFDAAVDELRAIYLEVARAEGLAAVLAHVRRAPRMCWATRGGPADVALAGLVNPLLARAEPLSFELHRPAVFLSGRNGVGKSTFLRALGVNLAIARAFGFCYAESARVPMLPVLTSVTIEDSLADGESLYMAEMRRAETLLRAVEQGPVVVLFDEIFRGTNGLESASAAAAVLGWIAHRAVVVVSSHNLVLPTLLADAFDCRQLVRATRDAPPALVPGVLSDPNGIEMMEGYDIPAAIRAEARRIAGALVEGLARAPRELPAQG